jgi:hypothetical protein
MKIIRIKKLGRGSRTIGRGIIIVIDLINKFVPHVL